ncbi:MAG: shikimate dehydrogenase [Deltaproteobacteria bacterium]|nr:shikimate dehydrogenase [Deltaproteobacteria bacterium]
MREISGRTRFTAIFGDPVEHSLSPAMHNAAYAALGIERAYLAFHVAPGYLHDAIRALPALEIAGVNLTVPHKENAVAMMTHVSEEVLTLGAINCVVNRNGELYGDNTDARGLELDLRGSGVALEGRTVLIVGAGGAAASAVLACIRMRAGKILLCNRTVERAIRLAQRLADSSQAFAGISIYTGGLDRLAEPATLADIELMINATPMGLKTGGFAPLAYDAAPADCIFYDMIYAREPTPFMAPALALGRHALDGAGMLLNQGALAFELFNNIAAPVAAMRAALMAALGRA